MKILVLASKHVRELLTYLASQLVADPSAVNVEQFEEAGILRETTGYQRNRRYRYDPYLSLFESPDFAPFAPPGEAGGDDQMTATEEGRPS